MLVGLVGGAEPERPDDIFFFGSKHIITNTDNRLEFVFVQRVVDKSGDNLLDFQGGEFDVLFVLFE